VTYFDGYCRKCGETLTTAGTATHICQRVVGLAPQPYVFIEFCPICGSEYNTPGAIGHICMYGTHTTPPTWRWTTPPHAELLARIATLEAENARLERELDEACTRIGQLEIGHDTWRTSARRAQAQNAELRARARVEEA
jgi:hypothetical protein